MSTVAEKLARQRPENPQWRKLAELASSLDERADSGDEVDDIFLSITGMAMKDWINELALPEVFKLVYSVKEVLDGGRYLTDTKSAMSMLLFSAWVGGFGHGLNRTRGIDISVYDDPEGGDSVDRMNKRMYCGLDISSVDYVAAQRVMREEMVIDVAGMLSSADDENMISLATYVITSYSDGFLVGTMFGNEEGREEW